MSGKSLHKNIKQVFSMQKVAMQLLCYAYKQVSKPNQYITNWDEEEITLHLCRFMRESQIVKKFKLDVVHEYTLDKASNLSIKDNHPKSLPRIDIMISSWYQDDFERLFFEAKNLYQDDYIKTSKVKAHSSQYLNRYIETGIKNIVIEKYPNAILLGYVLQGCTNTVIEKLNKKLKENRYVFTNKEIGDPKKICDLNLYASNHSILNSSDKGVLEIPCQSNKKELRHVFLMFE